MQIDQLAAADYQNWYHQIGRLLENAPDMSEPHSLKSAETLMWLGRGHALIEAIGRPIDAIAFASAVSRLRTAAWQGAVTEIFALLYRALGHCEIRSPAETAGAFIPIGNTFDAFAAFSKLLQSATQEVMFVDPYLDSTALTDFGSAVPAGITIRLLADAKLHKPDLAPACARWVAQYGSSRPLEARLAPAKSLHDRALFIDGEHAWTLTQSLKDFARRSPAEIVLADATAVLKISAYQEIWSSAAPIA